MLSSYEPADIEAVEVIGGKIVRTTSGSSLVEKAPVAVPSFYVHATRVETTRKTIRTTWKLAYDDEADSIVTPATLNNIESEAATKVKTKNVDNLEPEVTSCELAANQVAAKASKVAKNDHNNQAKICLPRHEEAAQTVQTSEPKAVPANVATANIALQSHDAAKDEHAQTVLDSKLPLTPAADVVSLQQGAKYNNEVNELAEFAPITQELRLAVSPARAESLEPIIDDYEPNYNNLKTFGAAMPCEKHHSEITHSLTWNHELNPRESHTHSGAPRIRGTDFNELEAEKYYSIVNPTVLYRYDKYIGQFVPLHPESYVELRRPTVSDHPDARNLGESRFVVVQDFWPEALHSNYQAEACFEDALTGRDQTCEPFELEYLGPHEVPRVKIPPVSAYV